MNTLGQLLHMRSGLAWNGNYVDDSVSEVIEVAFGVGQSDVAGYAQHRSLANCSADRPIPSQGSIEGSRNILPGFLDYPSSEPTIEAKLTHSPGAPPRLWVMPRVLPPSVTDLIWRSAGACLRSCSQHSNNMRSPEAPMGCPKLLSPPSGLTGSSPSRS